MLISAVVVQMKDCHVQEKITLAIQSFNVIVLKFNMWSQSQKI